MLIESYVVEFAELKKCLLGLRLQDFIVISENIFHLTEKTSHLPQDLLADHTPLNHPEVMLLVNKNFARTLISNDESFEFLKKSHDIKNLQGVTLHLAFANPDLVNDLAFVSTKKTVDSVPVQTVGHEALLMAQKVQTQRHKENKAVLSKSLALYRG